MIPIESVVNLLLPLLVAMLTVVVAHPTLVKIARRKHLVDNPNARKLNKEPMPVLGGVGVTFGLMVAVGVACYVMPDFYLPAEVVIAIVVLLYTGVADDILDLTPRRKLLLQAFVVELVLLAVVAYRSVDAGGRCGDYKCYESDRWRRWAMRTLCHICLADVWH